MQPLLSASAQCTAGAAFEVPAISPCRQSAVAHAPPETSTAHPGGSLVPAPAPAIGAGSGAPRTRRAEARHPEGLLREAVRSQIPGGCPAESVGRGAAR
jgi:hypothetical protein